jgi:hypothetical protein
MDTMTIGIDVSKDWLDVALCPTGESFMVKRTGAGIDELIARFRALSPLLVAVGHRGL